MSTFDPSFRQTTTGSHEYAVALAADALTEALRPVRKAAMVEDLKFERMVVGSTDRTGAMVDGVLTFAFKASASLPRKTKMAWVPVSVQGGTVQAPDTFEDSSGRTYPLTAESMEGYLGVARNEFRQPKRVPRVDVSITDRAVLPTLPARNFFSLAGRTAMPKGYYQKSYRGIDYTVSDVGGDVPDYKGWIYQLVDPNTGVAGDADDVYSTKWEAVAAAEDFIDDMVDGKGQYVHPSWWKREGARHGRVYRFLRSGQEDDLWMVKADNGEEVWVTPFFPDDHSPDMAFTDYEFNTQFEELSREEQDMANLAWDAVAAQRVGYMPPGVYERGVTDVGSLEDSAYYRTEGSERFSMGELVEVKGKQGVVKGFAPGGMVFVLSSPGGGWGGEGKWYHENDLRSLDDPHWRTRMSAAPEEAKNAQEEALGTGLYPEEEIESGFDHSPPDQPGLVKKYWEVGTTRFGERIAGPAMRNEETGEVVFEPGVFMHAALVNKYLGGKAAGWDSGFMTDEGRYVSRKEATEIAVDADQGIHGLERSGPPLDSMYLHWDRLGASWTGRLVRLGERVKPAWHNRDTGEILTGGQTHLHVLLNSGRMDEITAWDGLVSPWTDGFVLESGEFVTREEAWQIVKGNESPTDDRSHSYLVSEDLLAASRVMAEKIVGPAWFNHRTNRILRGGPTHIQVLINTGMMNVVAADPWAWEEGFETSEGRYVDREEAWAIALVSGQVDLDEAPGGWLASEDLTAASRATYPPADKDPYSPGDRVVHIQSDNEGEVIDTSNGITVRYDDGVEDTLGYFDAPLYLRAVGHSDSSVPTFDETATQLEERWVDHQDPTTSRRQGIYRAEMPQISGADKQEFLDWLGSIGVGNSRAHIPANQLTGTQSDFNQAKVDEMAELVRERALTASPPLVSSDGYVLDGHHRWRAGLQVDPFDPMEVIVVNQPISQLLETVREFSKTEYGKAASKHESALPDRITLTGEDLVYDGMFSEGDTVKVDNRTWEIVRIHPPHSGSPYSKATATCRDLADGLIQEISLAVLARGYSASGYDLISQMGSIEKPWLVEEGTILTDKSGQHFYVTSKDGSWFWLADDNSTFRVTPDELGSRFSVLNNPYDDFNFSADDRDIWYGPVQTPFTMRSGFDLYSGGR